MPADLTTFVLGLGGVYGILAGYMIRLDRRAANLENRLAETLAGDFQEPDEPGSDESE